jgi:threonine/homoserine/homoserine lactone efflux protein
MGLGLILGSETAKIILGLLGGGVLIWMGYDIIKGVYRKGFSIPDEASEASYSAYAPLTRGFIACVFNPYFIIWWATVGGAFIVTGSQLLGWMAPLVFLACHWASDFPWFISISYSISRGRRFLNEKSYGVLIVVCGIILSILGLNFLKDGLITVARNI